jgi:N-acetylneuraminic acid mutarotase
MRVSSKKGRRDFGLRLGRRQGPALPCNKREDAMSERLFRAAAAGVMPLLALAMLGLAVPGGAGHWTAKAPLPTAMAEVGVAAVGDKVYVLGGTAAGRYDSPLNEEYDPARDQWHERAPMPQGLSHVGAASLGGKLYAIGGFINVIHVGAQDAAFVYDPKTDRWSALPKLSSPRASVAAAAAGGKLHIFGGRGVDKVTVATHEVFDPKTGRWSEAAPLPGPPRDHAGIAVLDGKIHIFGGRTADVVDNLDRHDVYDPATGAWSKAAPLPRPRSSGAYTVLKGLILFAGGECKPGGKPGDRLTYDDVDGYDPKTDRWTALAPLPEGRHAFGAATVGTVAYFAGGTPTCGGGNTADMLAFTLP